MGGGKSLVDQWLSKYYTENGYYPTKVSYILWAGESARHEGIMESQIFYLWGLNLSGKMPIKSQVSE